MNETPKRRRKGRPSGQSPSVGREALIAAACNLLKTTQPSLITRALVARETQVDPSLIRYYFKNNAALLIATAEKLTIEYADTLQNAIDASDGGPESRLAARVGTLVDLIADYRYFHRLIVEEILPSNDELARGLMTKLTQRGTTGYDEILNAGVYDGRFRQVDPDLLFASIIALCEFYVSAKRIVDIARGEEQETEAAKREYKDFICDLILKGIRNPVPVP